MEDKERSLVGVSCNRYMIVIDWDGLKCNLGAGDSHYGRGTKSSFDGDCGEYLGEVGVVHQSPNWHWRRIDRTAPILRDLYTILDR